MRTRWSATLATFLGAIAILGAPRPLAGQVMASVLPQAGTRVRLVLESSLYGYKGDRDPIPESLVATLVTVDTGSVVVRRAAGTELRLPIARVRRLEVSGPGACRGSAQRMQCGAIGAAAGAGLGLLLIELSRSPWRENCVAFPSEPGCKRAAERRRRTRYAGFGAAVGLSVGLVVGRESWTPVTAWPPAR